MARGKYRAQVLTWDDILNNDDDFPDSDPSLYHHLILAEGDSWFTLAGIPTSNILFELRFHEPTMIVNIAYPGDSLKHISDLCENPQLKEALGRDGLAWDAILLSGGGNDLIDRANDLLMDRAVRGGERMPSVTDYCSEPAIVQLIDDIRSGFQRIVALRDQDDGQGRDKPVITHTYAYVTPRNSPARFFGLGVLGPWIFKAFTAKHIPRQDWLKLSDYLLDRLIEGHLGLAQSLAHFHVVDTRKRLQRAALGTSGNDADWLNEFHPNSEGYAKLAKAIEPTLLKLFA